MKIQLSDEDNLEISQRSVVEVISFLNQKSSDEKSAVLLKLFEEILREVNRFSEDRKDLTMTSLKVRNIFELYLITKHVNCNAKGLKSWCGQGYKDISDINNGFIQLMTAGEKGVFGDVNGLKESQSFLDSELAKSPYQSKVGFNIRQLAKDYGLDDHYMAIHKLCSKLIHPTSVKVNAYGALTKNDDYLHVLIRVGVFFCQEIEKLASNIKNA
ncbi:hypothetical protein [Vibrio sp. 3-2(1)]|uniref:hypothetical protein n=1 Tax=Vibrio sp. 3-2(1) TaxID=2591016 RepID=UPI001482CBE0|nr:hypothetical protein [Vibrio sp. 3-2(1)]NNN70942.1 hypothetical protein [Vibrio sp. 3-2(1)]